QAPPGRVLRPAPPHRGPCAHPARRLPVTVRREPPPAALGEPQQPRRGPDVSVQPSDCRCFEEADLIEEWCFERAAEDVPAADATAECVHWLRQDGGGIMRQRMLEDDQARRSVRRQMRAALREPYRLPEVGKGA